MFFKGHWAETFLKIDIKKSFFVKAESTLDGIMYQDDCSLSQLYIELVFRFIIIKYILVLTNIVPFLK